MTQFEGLAIGGKRVAAANGATAPTYNPATGEVLAQVAQASAADVDQAVRVAHDRFSAGAWKQMRSRERGQILGRIAVLIREKTEMLAQIKSATAASQSARHAAKSARWRIRLNTMQARSTRFTGRPFRQC